MRVLLLGDYSSVHYNLYLGLKEFGADVTLISSGDGYKKIPTDKQWITRSSSKISRLLGINGRGFMRDNKNMINSLSDFDVVQIVNPVIVEDASIVDNLELFRTLRERNDRVYLYSCGDDLNWVSGCLSSSPKKYWFSEPEFFRSKEIIHPIRYILNPLVRHLCKEVYRKVDGIIPGSLDYHWCIQGGGKTRDIIPFPIELNSLSFKIVRKGKTYRISHGKQRGKAIRKGDKYFSLAADLASAAFLYDSFGGVPFRKYISLIGEGDIFFDQIYSTDQGVNALLAMACGKIVFSGFGTDFLERYHQNENSIGIDARPDPIYLASMLNEIEIGRIDVEKVSFESRKFVENYHDHRVVATQFAEEWRK